MFSLFTIFQTGLESSYLQIFVYAVILSASNNLSPSSNPLLLLRFSSNTTFFWGEEGVVLEMSLLFDIITPETQESISCNCEPLVALNILLRTEIYPMLFSPFAIT